MTRPSPGGVLRKPHGSRLPAVSPPRRTDLIIVAAFSLLAGVATSVIAFSLWPPHTVTRIPAACQTAANQTAAHLQQLIDIHGSTGITVPLIRQDETALLTHCEVR